jgi:hypothetical protein
MQFKSVLVLIASASLAAAQQCKPDLLLDDFSLIRRGIVDEGAIANMNLEGGGYGGFRVEETFFSASRVSPAKVVVVPSAPFPNWWFFKVEKNACFDLRGYTAVKMEVKFPVNSYGKFALTQKSKGCQTAPDHGRIINGLFFKVIYIHSNLSQ